MSIRNLHVAALATGTAVLLDLGSREAKGDVLEKSAGSTAVLAVSGGHEETHCEPRRAESGRKTGAGPPP
jgi:hypothetical protein